CKTVYPGSIPGVASRFFETLQPQSHRPQTKPEVMVNEIMPHDELAALHSISSPAAIRGTGGYGIIRWPADHSGFAPENLTTLPHFSVSSAMSLPKSLGEPVRAMPPRSASRAFILGSATPASISLLSLSMISTGVLLGAPTPNQPLAS